jgi:hypothetical protein
MSRSIGAGPSLCVCSIRRNAEDRWRCWYRVQDVGTTMHSLVESMGLSSLECVGVYKMIEELVRHQNAFLPAGMGDRPSDKNAGSLA